MTTLIITLTNRVLHYRAIHVAIFIVNNPIQAAQADWPFNTCSAILTSYPSILI